MSLRGRRDEPLPPVLRKGRTGGQQTTDANSPAWTKRALHASSGWIPRGRFDANAREEARELLEEPDFAGGVNRMPFRPGDKVMGVGDSVTDDSRSWLEIVRHLLKMRRPHDGIRTVNMGLSSHTTAMVLRRFVSYLSQKPGWIVCFLGSNDATRVGPEPKKPQTSLEETAKNLQAIRNIAAKLTDARGSGSRLPSFKMGQSH